MDPVWRLRLLLAIGDIQMCILEGICRLLWGFSKLQVSIFRHAVYIMLAADILSDPEERDDLHRVERSARQWCSAQGSVEIIRKVSYSVWELAMCDSAERLRDVESRELGDKHYLGLCRMDKTAFDDLYALVGPDMESSEDESIKDIPGKKRMAIFLSWLAHGELPFTLAYVYNISQPALSNIIDEGIAVFEKWRQTQFSPPLSQRDIQDVTRGFEELAALPGCVGAVDGTFFSLRKPAVWPSAYHCYRKRFAIIVLVVCDADLIIRYVSAGSCSTCGDANVWDDCSFKKHLKEGAMDLQPPVRIGSELDTAQEVLSYVVAKTDFALDPRVISRRPFPIGAADNTFNAAVNRTRRVVRAALRRLKGRWHIFEHNSLNDPVKARRVAMICCALHNWCQHKVPESMYDAQWELPRDPAAAAARRRFDEAMRRINAEEREWRETSETVTERYGGLLVQGLLQDYLVGTKFVWE